LAIAAGDLGAEPSLERKNRLQIDAAAGRTGGKKAGGKTLIATHFGRVHVGHRGGKIHAIDGITRKYAEGEIVATVGGSTAKQASSATTGTAQTPGTETTPRTTAPWTTMPAASGSAAGSRSTRTGTFPAKTEGLAYAEVRGE
jgi:hypothetical protein